jgi:hypothetical protein
MAHAVPKKFTLSWLQEHKNLAWMARKPYEANWAMNMAYIRGDQYVDYVYDTGRLVERLPEDADLLPVRNFMFKLYRGEMARLTNIPLTPNALPPGSGLEEHKQSRIMNAYFRSLMELWNFAEKHDHAADWVTSTGNVVLKWAWENDNNRMTVISPFDFYPDPYAKTWDECPWAIQSIFYDVDVAKSVYGKDKRSKVDLITQDATSEYTGMDSRLSLAYPDGARGLLPGALINEFWHRPTDDCPKGKYIVYCGGGIILETDFPYTEHGMLPFTHVGHTPVTNSKWCESIFTAIRPIADETNRAEARNIKNANMSQGKWFLALELELEADPDADALQILRQTGGPLGVKPELLTGSTVPQWVAEEPSRLQAIAEDLAGHHEVSQGGVPGRVDSASGITLLQEKDESVTKRAIRSMERAIARGFFMCAANAKQFGEENMLIESYDESGRAEVHQLKTDEINLKFRVTVQTTTALPTTVAGKMDRVLLFFQNQLIDAPTAIKLLDLSSAVPDLQTDQADRDVAYRENITLSEGDVVRPAIYQNHAAHRQVHDSYRKTAEYDQLPEMTKKLFEFHDMEHKQMELQQAMEQAQIQAAMQGALMGPPPGGAPAGPGGEAPAGEPQPPTPPGNTAAGPAPLPS